MGQKEKKETASRRNLLLTAAGLGVTSLIASATDADAKDAATPASNSHVHDQNRSVASP